ncbi:MAG: hypothetical protein RSG48_06865 [Clostridia bacterium]
MALNISEDILTAQNTLLRQSNGRQIQEYMDKNNYGDQTPVDTYLLKMDNDRKIIITDEIQEKLDVINEVCKTEGGEIPYFLTGTKLEDETIRFDKIIISYGSMERQSANFSKESVEQLNQFVTDNKDNQNAIVCHGHTHPQHGSFYNQFSIGDLGAYVNFKNNQKFGQVDTIGMVLVDGSYNFIEYNKNQFYKIKNVFREVEENQKYELLPSYSKERFWKKIVTKVKEFYNNMKPNKGEVKPRLSQVGINECGEIIRGDKDREFLESLKSEIVSDTPQIVSDTPQIVPPNRKEERDFQDGER